MRANRVSAYVFAVAASLAACRGSGDVQYAGDVRVSSPELVMISPGVQVIADADEPLFYSDGSYWLYRDGYWLRSADYRRGFVRVDISYVPQRVRLIERPQTYVQYRRTHARDYQARVQMQNRERPEPVEREPMPPQSVPNQGVPSTPEADTWQRGQTNVPPGDPTGIDPTVPTPPAPTPPITSPADVHGNKMPSPGAAPIVTDPPPGHGSPPATPPGQAGRPSPHDRGTQARPDDRGNNRSQQPPRGRDTKPSDRTTPPPPPPADDAREDAKDTDKND